ncbi:MAG: hypothetical protein LUE64_03490, partial [Candidatus Gastranaerophilales bacterium]|nr:hypothetical protein [Candidatus Gastranaerophilales bacterium]
MSTNSNLEVKVNELTNVIRNLSDKPVLSQNDVNELLNNLVKRVEDANLEGFDKLSNDVSDSLIAALENKYKDIEDRISLFENFIANVEKTVQNPKADSEITRILNDIEALHSKMNSQELQTDSLIKSFEAMKNSSQGGQITKLCDEIVAISKSYDGITEVLNNNFQDFLRRVEALSSREEFQRLRYFLESIEGSQNVIVSALNAVNDKQEEIKNLVKNTAAQGPEKYESLQSVINQMNRFMLEMPEKSDIDSINDKVSVLSSLFGEFKRVMESNGENDFRAVFQSQLNNIINRLESLKTNNGSNVSEDIIKLYTSIAEFKNALYSSIEEQLGGITTSFDAQFDKISNSVVNSALDSTEAITNLTGEVQKLNSLVIDGINSKTAEIKESFQKTAHENILTVVNSINGEILTLKNDIASININEATSNLLDKIESIQSGLDFDSLILQINQIKETLNLEPIKAQLEELNQDDAVQSLSRKIDFLTEAAEKNEIASKLDLLLESINPQFVQSALDSINQKMENINAQDEDKLKFALSLDEISNKISDVDLKINENNPRF